MLCALSAPPAAAADFDWQIVTGLSTDYLEREVQRAPPPTAIACRPSSPTPPAPRSSSAAKAAGCSGGACRQRPNIACSIRATLQASRARRGGLHAARDRQGAHRPGARDLPSACWPGRRRARLSIGAGRARRAARSAADARGRQGYRVIASIGDAGSEWVIVEREANSGGGREAREARGWPRQTSISSKNRSTTSPHEGFGCDAVWNRPPKGLALFKGAR